MSRAEKLVRFAVFAVLMGLMVALPLPEGEHRLELQERLWAVGITLGLMGLGLWTEHRQRARLRELTGPIDPAIPPPAPVDALLAEERHLAPLRGKVRELRTYSTPGISETGMLEPSYHSVLIDTNAEVHELEQSDRFGALETRAATLAERLAVPFNSGI